MSFRSISIVQSMQHQSSVPIRRADFAREFAFVAISGKTDKQTGALLRHDWNVSYNPEDSTLESSGKRKSKLCKSVTRSHKVSTLPRWLLTPHLRVCAGLHWVSTYEPCGQSKMYTGAGKPCTSVLKVSKKGQPCSLPPRFRTGGEALAW